MRRRLLQTGLLTLAVLLVSCAGTGPQPLRTAAGGLQWTPEFVSGLVLKTESPGGSTRLAFSGNGEVAVTHRTGNRIVAPLLHWKIVAGRLRIGSAPGNDLTLVSFSGSRIVARRGTGGNGGNGGNGEVVSYRVERRGGSGGGGGGGGVVE